jgi:hypothetical protein
MKNQTEARRNNSLIPKKKGALFTGKAHFGLALDKCAPVLGGRCRLLKQLQSTHTN